MARGWESKSVESQIEGAQQTRNTGPKQLSGDERDLQREKQKLLLSRAYVRQQIESSANGRYTETLRQAMEEIDRKLADLNHDH